MPARHQDWIRQSKRDLEQAQHSIAGGYHEWACFAAHQAAEKAAKALYQRLGADAWGRSVGALLANLPEGFRPSEELLDRARELDHHYIPPRYPNALPEGIPGDYYTRTEAERALDHARAVIKYCEDNLL